MPTKGESRKANNAPRTEETRRKPLPYVQKGKDSGPQASAITRGERSAIPYVLWADPKYVNMKVIY